MSSWGPNYFSGFSRSAFSHRVCWGRWWIVQFLPHLHELSPVCAETPRVDAGVHHQAAVGAAGALVPQGEPCLPLRHVVADVDGLHQQQVKQPSGDDAAVPGAGEAECSAGTRQWQKKKVHSFVLLVVFFFNKLSFILSSFSVTLKKSLLRFTVVESQKSSFCANARAKQARLLHLFQSIVALI